MNQCRWYYFFTIVLLTFNIHPMVAESQSNHATVDASWSINIPSMDYKGTSYEIVLNYYDHPADPFNSYWSLAMNSIGMSQPSGSSGSTLEPLSLQITIPYLEYKGFFYQVVFDSYSNPMDSSTLYWKLNSIKVVDLDGGGGFGLNQAYNAAITNQDFWEDGYYFHINFVPNSSADYKVNLDASGLTNPYLRLYLDDGNYSDLDDSGDIDNLCVSAALNSGSAYQVQVRSASTGTFQLLWEEGTCGKQADDPFNTPNGSSNTGTGGGSETTDEIPTGSDNYVPAAPDPEFDYFTWTLPAGASSIRLSLPADIDDFLFDEHGGIGGFGLHAGGHIEGLDHAWIELKPGTPVKSWADGVVEGVTYNGPPGEGEYHIIINYGDNLVGTHMEIDTPYVGIGDTVKRGQEVGMGMSFDPYQSSAEMGLVDRGRTDGVKAWGGGVAVSPFDYLMDSDKKALVEAYKTHVIEPYLKNGTEAWGFEPYQPYLTNKLFIHEGNEGKLTGVWYLISDNWGSGYPIDILTFIEADNPYYTGNHVLSLDYYGGFGGSWLLYGTFEADYGKGQVKIDDPKSGTIYYGIFEIDESADKAILKIEYQEDSYPSMFSNDALVYVQRGDLSPGTEAVDYGVLESP